MAMEEPETNESQIGLTILSEQRYDKTDDGRLWFTDSPTIKSLAAPPSNGEIIIIDDDKEEEVTLEPEKKKPRLGSWWDTVEPFDELSCVVKGSPEEKKDDDFVSRADSYISSTDLQEKSEFNESQIRPTFFSKQRYDKTDDGRLWFTDSPTIKSLAAPPSADEIIVIDDDEDEVTLEPEKKKPGLGSWWDIVEPFDDVIKGSPEAKEDNDVVSRADSCISFTGLQETESKEKNDDERSLPKEENEESTTRNMGYEHVTLEKLGVSMEDLKSIPLEAFNPTMEIMSDPLLGGYVASLWFNFPHLNCFFV